MAPPILSLAYLLVAVMYCAAPTNARLLFKRETDRPSLQLESLRNDLVIHTKRRTSICRDYGRDYLKEDRQMNIPNFSGGSAGKQMKTMSSRQKETLK